MSVFVVRAFVRMRALLAGDRQLACELAALKKKLTDRLNVHESAIVEALLLGVALAKRDEDTLATLAGCLPRLKVCYLKSRRQVKRILAAEKSLRSVNSAFAKSDHEHRYM
jgi:phage shock protein A